MRRGIPRLTFMAVLAVVACARPATEPAESVPTAETPDPRRAEVLAVVQRFFDTMTARDVEGAERVLLLDGQFHSIRPDPGAPVRSTPLARYLEGLATGTRRQTERMWNPEVMVDDRIAMVWTPYEFHNDDELSHCGIDVFSLLRTDDGWRITGVTYTVEPDGCERLGRPTEAGRP